MAAIQSYEDLEIWKQGIELVSKIYSLTKLLPKQEQWGLISQLNRASVSVPTNIAEGWGRGHSPSQCQFLRVARGSLYEVKTLLVVCCNEYPEHNDKARSCLLFAETLGKKLNSYLSTVSSSVNEEIARYTADQESDSEIEA